ncbi:hypothetical protein PR202_gb10220 [Eleusine coracana subsp. coracana]|uniref:Uncharacterized protein n=1 Tax=Eleusine coracana subsp. coracana TaxID=191504 RepID=A0AAV5EJJ8_ELECO|nr:hypothetical protein PR202_gb10220 [Eleusine coracana subsp. coracana]
MLLRQLHAGVPRGSLASVAALLHVAPRARLPSVGLLRRLHDAAGDGTTSSGDGMRTGPLTLYRNLVNQGKLTHDVYQENVATELQKLLRRLEQYEMEMEDYHTRLSTWDDSREKHRRKLLVEEAEDKQRKTMLMDMFYGATEGVIKHRRRFHFHEAMLEIHDHMHDVWKTREDDKSDQSNAFSWISHLPFDAKIKEWLIGEEKYKQETQQKHILLAVADRFLVDRQANKTGASILCFDEIQDGMQRDIFLELLSKLDENCSKILVGTEKDYRRLIPTEGSTQVHYFWPLTSDTRSMFEATWHDTINQTGGNIISVTIPVMFGRSIEIPQSCNGVARFDFEYLCGRPVGAADYIAIARNYHTIFISDVPAMSMKIRDKISRLIEMQTPLYLERAQQAHPSFQQQGPALASNRIVSQPAPSV